MKNNSAEPKKKANKIYSNIGLKLLSVVLGFLVWLLVLNIDDSAVTRTIRDIPVNLVNTDAITSQNQLYTITSGDTVDIVVKGRKSLISCGEDTPEDGYLDLVRMFMKNMSFYLQRNYENQRHGRMMYETFLANLLGTAEIPEDRITEQVNMIDGLEETGYFALGILDFSNQENVPLKFLARLLERQSWEIKPFLYEKHICLLKYSKVPFHQEFFFNEKELGILRQLLEQYQYRIGISNIFNELRCLRDAYTQAVFTLAWNENISQKTKEQVIYQYKDVVMYHLFSKMEDEMNPRLIQSELYCEVAKYDREHHSAYEKTVLCYLKNDCSATRTAAELGIHRNTVRNMILSVEETYGISLDDAEEKMRYILSEQIEQYFVSKNER